MRHHHLPLLIASFALSLALIACAKGGPVSGPLSGTSGTHGETCGAEGHEGQLTPVYDAGKQLTGWRCVLGDGICDAGPDGIWMTCTFPPPGWPERVPENLLRNPPPPPPPAEPAGQYGSDAGIMRKGKTKQ